MVKDIHIYDKFHVVEKVTEVVDNVRRNPWNQKKDEEYFKLLLISIKDEIVKAL